MTHLLIRSHLNLNAIISRFKTRYDYKHSIIMRLYLVMLGLLCAWLLFNYGMQVPFPYRLRGDAFTYFDIARHFHSIDDALTYVGERSPGMPWFDYIFMKQSTPIPSMVNHMSYALFMIHELSILFFCWVLSRSPMALNPWGSILFTLLMVTYPTFIMHTTTVLTDTLSMDCILLAFSCLVLTTQDHGSHRLPCLFFGLLSGVLLAYAVLVRPAYAPAVFMFIFIYFFLTLLTAAKKETLKISWVVQMGLILSFLMVFAPVVIHNKAHFGKYCIENPYTFSIVRHIKDGLVGARIIWFAEPTSLSFFPIIPDAFMVNNFHSKCSIVNVFGIKETSLMGCLIHNMLYSFLFFIKKWIGLLDAFRMTPYTETMTPTWYLRLSRAYSLVAFLGLGVTLIRGFKQILLALWRKEKLLPLYAGACFFCMTLLLSHSLLHVEERFIFPCIPLFIYMFLYQMGRISTGKNAYQKHTVLAWTGFFCIMSSAFILQVMDWDARLTLENNHPKIMMASYKQSA